MKGESVTLKIYDFNNIKKKTTLINKEMSANVSIDLGRL